MSNKVGIYQLLNGMWNKIDDNVSAASQEAQAQYTTFKENNMDPVIEGWAIDHLQTSDLLKELTMMFGSDFYSTNHQNFATTGEGTKRMDGNKQGWTKCSPIMERLTKPNK